MSEIAELEDKLKSWAADITDRAQRLVSEAVPVVHDGAESLAKLTSSRIVTELEQYGEDILPSTTVDAVVSLIHDAGEAATRIAALTGPPADPAPEQPAQ